MKINITQNTKNGKNIVNTNGGEVEILQTDEQGEVKFMNTQETIAEKFKRKCLDTGYYDVVDFIDEEISLALQKQREEIVEMIEKMKQEHKGWDKEDFAEDHWNSGYHAGLYDIIKAINNLDKYLMKEELTNIDKKIEEFNKRFGSFEVFFDESKKQYIYPQSEMVSFLRQALLDIQKETAREMVIDIEAIEPRSFSDVCMNVVKQVQEEQYRAITGEDYSE